jgi:hypothetical protein
MPKSKKPLHLGGGGQTVDSENVFFLAMLGIRLMPKIIIPLALMGGGVQRDYTVSFLATHAF